ncbi:MAG: hypothetical protein ABIU06_11810 [Anaerolineales bacterium]
MPKHWKRLRFKFFHRGELQVVDTLSSKMAT